MAIKNMMHHKALKELMYSLGVTQRELARQLGLSEQAMNSKINSRTSFTVPEIEKTCAALNIDNPTPYFFNFTST